jgi:hypothetical protein
MLKTRVITGRMNLRHAHANQDYFPDGKHR